MVELKLRDAIDYVIKKRDDEINFLVDILKAPQTYSEDKMYEALRNVRNLNKQLTLLENCLVTLTLEVKKLQ
jgi:hypothetical protein